MESNLTLALQEMLAELDSSRLEVILVPQRYRTNEGGMVRVAVSKNAAWYRRFCAAYLSSRRRRNLASDTAIKRQATIRTLEALIAGRPVRGLYASRLAALAERRASAMEAAPF